MNLTPLTGRGAVSPAPVRFRRSVHRCAVTLILTVASVLPPATAFATPASRSALATEMVAAPDDAGVLTISPDSASVGERLAIDGNGFAPDEAIDLHWPGETGPVLVSLAADDAGAFSTTVPLPETPVGDRALVAVGKTSGQTADDWIEVTPSLGVSPASAAPGAEVTLSVRGLGADEAFNVYWGDGTGPAWAFGRTDGAGSATVRAATPGKQPGRYDLVVTGLTSNQRGVGTLELLDPAAGETAPATPSPAPTATTTDAATSEPTPLATIDAGPDTAAEPATEEATREVADTGAEPTATPATPAATVAPDPTAVATPTPDERPAPDPTAEPAKSTGTGREDEDNDNAAVHDDESDENRRERKKDARDDETRVNPKVVKANEVRDQFGLPLIPEDAVPTGGDDADNEEPAADANDNGNGNAEKDVAAAMIATLTAGGSVGDPTGDAAEGAAPAAESAGTVPVQISDPSGAAENADAPDLNADATDAADGTVNPVDGSGDSAGDATVDDGSATGQDGARPERTRRNEPAPDALAPGDEGEIAQQAEPAPDANGEAIQNWQAPGLATTPGRQADTNPRESGFPVIRPVDGGASPAFEAKKRERTGEGGNPGPTSGANLIPPVPPIPVIPVVEEPPAEAEPESETDAKPEEDAKPDDDEAAGTDGDSASDDAENPDRRPRDERAGRDDDVAPETSELDDGEAEPEITGDTDAVALEPDNEDADTPSDPADGAPAGTDPEAAPESAPDAAPEDETSTEPVPIATIEPAPTAEPTTEPERVDGEEPAADAPTLTESTVTPTPTPVVTPVATEPAPPTATGAPTPAAEPEPTATTAPEPTPTSLLAPADRPATREVALAPVADTTVWSTTPDDPQPPMQVTVLPDGGPDGAVVYLTFAVEDIAPGTLVSARLFVTGSVGWGPAGEVGVVPGQGVDEASLTYNTAPWEQFTAADRAGNPSYIDNLAPGVEQSADVTTAITGPGPVTFVFRGLSWNGLALASRESPTPPRLVLSLAE